MRGGWIPLLDWCDPPPPPEGFAVEVKRCTFLGTTTYYRLVPADADVAAQSVIEGRG